MSALPSRATISLCMIVRDAESSLAAALVSAKPFMDEMVVVDTGSRDGSKAVAAASGARVFEFAWCDDFSAARNFSIEQATGDWVFWMDADDVLPAESGSELRRVVAAHPQRDAAFWVTVEEESRGDDGRRRTMGHAHLKLFPRHRQIRFRYRVHEQVSPSIKELGIPFTKTRAVVRHAHADRSPQGERARLERNLRLLLRDLQDYPNDAFVLLNLGTTYLFLPDGLPIAAEYIRKGVDGFPRASSTQLNAYLYLGQAHGWSGDREAERCTYSEALDIFPNDAVLLMRLGAVLENTGRLEEAAQYYRTALQRGKVRLSAVHLRGGPSIAVLRLGRIYIKTGRRGEAERLWQRYLACSPNDAAIRGALADLQGHSGSIFAG